jgi:sphinganine-1-phosphate aldolase
MYNGDYKTACGIGTSGGTESIMLCMLAYREQMKAEKGITKPNIVMSNTAHVAFDKAAFYFGIEIRKVPVGPDHKLDLRGIQNKIDSNTICLVASCPEYPFGTYDPISKIAALAQYNGIGCHSDCCLGSYINPFIDELGYKLPEVFDFRIPGITSISCDPHKYACGPKGFSVALFRTKELRDYQMFITSTWNGGVYGTTSMAGSRPGNIVMGTWASFMKQGMKGLRENAHKILEA